MEKKCEKSELWLEWNEEKKKKLRAHNMREQTFPFDRREKCGFLRVAFFFQSPSAGSMASTDIDDDSYAIYKTNSVECVRVSLCRRRHLSSVSSHGSNM